MKLLVDMNLSPRWVAVLVSAGFEALHCSTAGCERASDTEIMDLARQQDYVVLTNDLDFSAILAATQESKPSVIQIRANRVSPELIASNVIHAIGQMKAELETGALLTIDADRTRLRLLPLR